MENGNENVKMDYGAEVEKLKSGSGSTFKPDAGIYKVVILSEPEESNYHDDVKNTDTPQIKLSIEHDQAEGQFTWFMSKGVSFISTYGQLMAVGSKKGQLMGEVITLIVKEGKDKKEYTIVEAAEIIKANADAEKSVEEVKVE